MMEKLGKIFRKYKVKKELSFVDCLIISVIVLVSVVSVTFKFNFKNIDGRLLAAYTTGGTTGGTTSGVTTTSGTTPTSVTPTEATYSCGTRCSNTTDCLQVDTASHSPDCNLASQFAVGSRYEVTCCAVQSCERASNVYGCTWSSWSNYGDCSAYNPASGVTYTTRCDANFIETDPNCIANCKCPTCTGGFPGDSPVCTAVQNSPPIFGGLVIKNNIGTIVNPESGNRNQICDSGFNRTRLVTFEVFIYDPDGIGDIANVTLRLNGVNIPRIGNIGEITTFGWNSSDAPAGIDRDSAYPLEVVITDSYGQIATDSSRYFKFWNCNVAIGGNIYDSTNEGGPVCPNSGFSLEPDSNVLNFKSLAFVRSGTNVEMTVGSNGTSYSSGSNYLTWGLDGYVPQFNNDISLSNREMRSRDITSSNWLCNWYVDTSNIDPYNTDPSILADFSGILIQDPWWQTVNGGVVSNNQVDGKVPITCSEDYCKISQGGLVSGPIVENSSGKSLASAQNWYYSGPSAKLANVNSNYSYFYNQYYVKNNQGTVLNGNQNMSDLISGLNGIYFINGDLNINIDVATANFVMFVVSGNISVDQSVSQVNGIYVANNITAAGVNDLQLTFNGSLFASGSISFTRDHSNRLLNNTNPSVVVNYNPQLIFKLPGSLAKVLTNWQWGN